MSKVTAHQVAPSPYNWQPDRAGNLPDTLHYIDKHRTPALPLSTAMFAIIFFEESTCCNTIQKPPYAIGPGQIQVADFWPRHFFAGENPAGDRKDNAMGGRWDSSITTWAVDTKTGRRIARPKRLRSDLPELTQSQIFADFEFGVKMHVKMMEWEWKGHGNGVPKSSFGQLLGSQLGGQSGATRQKARAAFVRGANDLEGLLRKKPTLQFGADGSLDASFYEQRRRAFASVLNAARSAIKGNPVGFKHFSKFWEYFLPDGFLEDPAGYLRCGF